MKVVVSGTLAKLVFVLKCQIQCLFFPFVSLIWSCLLPYYTFKGQATNYSCCLSQRNQEGKKREENIPFLNQLLCFERTAKLCYVCILRRLHSVSSSTSNEV